MSRDELLEKTSTTIADFVRDDVIGYWAKHAAAAARKVTDDRIKRGFKPSETLPPTNDFSDSIIMPAARKMLAVSTGAKKSGAAIDGALDVIEAERAAGRGGAAYILGPHHKLTEELAARISRRWGERVRDGVSDDTWTRWYISDANDWSAPAVEDHLHGGLHILRWLGRLQPDPTRPGELMCQRPADVEVVERFGLPVDQTLCEGCPLATACGYQRQMSHAPFADVVVATHQALQRLAPSLPDPLCVFVDESAWSSKLPEDSKIPLGSLRKRPGDRLPAEVRAARAELATVLEAESDGAIRADLLHDLIKSLEAKGLSPAELANREFAAAEPLKKAVATLTGAELELALQEQLGDAGSPKAARRMYALWMAVAGAGELPAGARSGRLELVTTDRENDVREIRVRFNAGLAKRWTNVPMMFLDATADATVLSEVFGGVTPAPRYVAFNEHVKIRQVVDRSLSHGAIAPPTADELKDAKPPKLKAAATARRNALKLKAALIADALGRYDGAPVLAVVPAATERVWREGPLPSWLSVAHHGATVGLDSFGHVRALYDVGRTLPAAGAVERMAGAITGVQPAVTGYRETKREIVGVDGSAVVVAAWEHPDALCAALRWQLCEGALIQNCGRGRGLHRTADTPLDIAIWTDIAVPELGPVEHVLWQGPTADDEMLAAGVWLELPADAARVHPEVVVSAAALKQARIRYDQRHLLIGTYISKCRYSYRYRPANGQRSAVGRAAFLNETSEAEARAFLEARLGPLALLEAIAPPPEIEVVDAAATHTPLPLPRPRKPVLVWPEPGSIDRRPVDVTALFDPNRPMPLVYGLRSGIEHARN
jgi:putative DNA primase/helicase